MSAFSPLLPGEGLHPIEFEGFEPGIYLGMPEDRYHKLPGLSSSLVKQMRKSPSDFWARSWLNTKPPAEDDEEKFSHIVGHAYHARILRGRAALDAEFSPPMDASALDGTLDTIAQMKTELAARGAKVGGTRPELMARLRELDTDKILRFTDDAQEEYDQLHAGKTYLKQDILDSIEIAAHWIEQHPKLKLAFQGGAPEITILWYCAESGVPCKSRVDYLKPRAIIDLKSFASKYDRPVDRAIMSEFANYRYFVQAAMYLEAASHVAQFIKDGAVFGKDLVDQSLLDGLERNDEKTFMFVFQQKGIAPLARGKILLNGSRTLDIGRLMIEEAKLSFLQNWEAFGTDPWVDAGEITNIADEDVPSYAFE